MVRKLVLAMAAAGALSSTTANALGLGEITLRSALNQPLNAQIELIEVKGLGQGEILPNLAAKKDFSLAGVDRDFFLNELKFKTVVRANGTAYVEVSTRKPVREPYLNFLVELQWPNGRLLREYALLLDPPTFTEEVMAPVAPPAAAQIEPVVPGKPAASTPMVSQPAKAVVPQSSVQVESADVKGGGTYGETGSKDTLWKVAQKHRPSRDVTIQQTMIAIQELNPDAFIKSNINLLKKGQVLRLPTLEQVEQTTKRQAVTEVAMQNQQWAEQRALKAPQLDASRQSGEVIEPMATDKDGTLTLASAGQNTTGQGGTDNGTSSSTSANADALQNELAISQEKLDKAVRESSEVAGQLGELEEQVETLQRLLSLKDEQLAALQAQLATTAEPEGEVDYNYVEEQSSTAESATKATPAASSTPVESVKPEMVKPEALKAEPVAKAEPKPVPKPAPKPVVTPEVEETGLLDDILQNPLYMYIGGGVAALLLVLLVIARRKSSDKGSDEEALQDLSIEDDGAEDGLSDVEQSEDSVDSDLDEMLSLDGEEGAAQEESTTAQTADALGEADIYIAYGRYNQAVELLTNAIAQEPARSDLRVKLLEAYAEMKDAEAFVAQENELSALGDSIAMQEAETFKAKFPAGALEAVGSLLSDSGESGLGVDSLDEALSLDDMNSVDTAIEFSLDDLELDSHSEDTDLDVSDKDMTELSGDDASLLDFELDDEVVAGSGENDLLVDLDSELDGGLETELDLELGSLEELDETEFSLDEELSLDSGEEETFDLADLDSDTDLSELGANVDSAKELEELSLDVDAGNDLGDEFDLSLEVEEPTTPELEIDTDDLDDSGLSDIDFELPATEELASEAASDSVSFDLEEAVAEEPEPVEELTPDFNTDSLAMDSEMAALDEATESLAAEFDEEGDEDMDDEFDFLAGTNETATKLDLARAYVDMGDVDGAKDILDEVLKEGDESQLKEAKDLLDQIG